jgi:ribonucleoside-diphosphate reductase alpha chain
MRRDFTGGARVSKSTQSVDLPIKRVTGETLEERLTENAYERILPARYLRKDAEGELVEAPEELFERVAENVALADAVHEADRRGTTIEVRPDQVKPEHGDREELVAEVFGDDVAIGDDVTAELTERNVSKFAYDTVVPELDDELAAAVSATRDEFQEAMERLSFIPNSPTLMNAGDELQQLSACFVDSPDDDMQSIHETAKEAAAVFQSGGGMGYAFWRLRPYGDPVGSTGGIASGPITFMRTFDQMCETIAQGGTRRGAQMGVMRVSHPDVIQFIHAKNKDVSLAHALRLNDPDDYTHTDFVDALDEARELIDDQGRVPEHLRNAAEGHLSNFNISVGVGDDFMEALDAGEEFTFTNPRTGEPHVATEQTVKLYERFDLGEYVEEGEVLSVPAEAIWTRMVEGAYENGEPGVIYLDRVNHEHSFDVDEHEDHEILATNPCVTGDTLVSTGNGLVPAEELYEQGTAQDVVVDGRLSEDRIKEASSVYATGEKDVYELTTEEGYELRLTADHRVRTDDGWVAAEDLEPGDAVHVQNRKGGFGEHGTAEEGRVLGWLVGDGHLKHGEERAVLNFYDEDAAISDDLAADANAVVRAPTGNADYEIGVNEITRGDDYRGAEAVEQRVRSSRLYEYAEQAGLVEQKHQVPDAVMRGSEEMARGFLRSLFTADGGVQGDAEKGVSVRLTSTDLAMLKDVQRLLLNFGIFSKIYEERHEAGTQEMPDGDGGTAEYERQADHDLMISRDALLRFRDEIGFLLDEKDDALDERLASYDRGPYTESFDAVVESMEPDGHETVYDLTEPDTNSFVANGLVVHNCGEQPLEEYEACNLGHINLSTLADHDTPDWRVWRDEHAGEYDDIEEAVEAFLDEAIDWAEFDDRIATGTHFLENVVTMSDFPIEEIEQKVREMRKIGLGIMGLAQLYVQIGVRYGSDEANEIARQLMRHINHESKRTSHALAEERGVFEEWDRSKYADPLEYRDWFEHQTGESADDWPEGYPVRNHNTTTIAPTGTTSMIGNTTGGCEPIYNVAYYKNVSDDVQGDEMLVEFDDYFLRTLEANDVDVDAVKQEAEEQMANNAFDGVEGLETVPDAIGELFVTTGDLSAKQHAAVQCACQRGVDSAISKTVNAPHDSTVEDAKEVYEYIYEHGGKGVTYYRDGTRSKQVLTTRADNKSAADEDPVDAVQTMLEEGDLTLQELAADVDGVDVWSPDEGDAATAAGAPGDAATAAGGDGARAAGGAPATLGSDDFEPRGRPDHVSGATQKIETGYGGLYVTINEDEQGMFEVFAQIGKSGGYTTSFTEGIARLTSLCLRSGIPPKVVIDQLEGIRSPKVTFDRGEQIHSVPDAIAKAMDRYSRGELDVETPAQSQLPIGEDDEVDGDGETAEPDAPAETDGGAAAAAGGTAASAGGDAAGGATGGTADVQELIDRGRNPECPECDAMLVYTEGCVKCNDCGYSEC